MIIIYLNIYESKSQKHKKALSSISIIFLYDEYYLYLYKQKELNISVTAGAIFFVCLLMLNTFTVPTVTFRTLCSFIDLYVFRIKNIF